MCALLQIFFSHLFTPACHVNLLTKLFLFKEIVTIDKVLRSQRNNATKPEKWPMHPAKAQISLIMHPAKAHISLISHCYLPEERLWALAT